MAVTSGNHVTILRKDDDYRKPCGTFTGYLPLLHKCVHLLSPFKFGLWIQLFFFVKSLTVPVSNSTRFPKGSSPHYAIFLSFCFLNHDPFSTNYDLMTSVLCISQHIRIIYFWNMVRKS